MRRSSLTPVIAALLLSATSLARPSVTLTLESSLDGQTVAVGALIDWTIRVDVSAGDNAGLALIRCDLEQDAGNPARFDLPPGDPDSIDATMQHFSRPLAVSNPGETHPPTGYVGVQRGATNQKNLVQIGGSQNTFGAALPPGTGMGEAATVLGGVGQSGPQILLSGSFTAPNTPGTYTFRLDNARSSVLVVVNPPPAASPVVSVNVSGLADATFSFTVSEVCRGDCNCDDQIDFDDINAFVAALDPMNPVYCDGTGERADVNGDGEVDFDDINPFVSLLTENPLPIICP